MNGLSRGDHPDDMLFDAEAVAVFLADVVAEEPEILTDKGWQGLAIILAGLAATIRSAIDIRAAKAA